MNATNQAPGEISDIEWLSLTPTFDIPCLPTGRLVHQFNIQKYPALINFAFLPDIRVLN